MSALFSQTVVPGDEGNRHALSMRCVRARLAGKSIFLAEDNPLSQELTRMLVERTGARLNVADNGVAALAALQAGRYDCVLMDVQLPLMDGDEVTRRLRAEERFADLPVLGLTGNGGSVTRQHCLSVGMNDFLVRPIDPALFYAVLTRWADPEGETVMHPACRGIASAADAEAADGLASLSVLAALVDNDPETMHRLLAIFLDSANTTIREMTAAAQASDWTLLRALSHRLMTSARAVGAMRFAAVCAALEQHAGSGVETAMLLADLRPMLYLMKAEHAAAASQEEP